MFAKKVHKNTCKYPSYLLSKCFSNLFLILTFFSDTNHGRGKIGGTFTSNVSLVPPVWTKIHTHCKNFLKIFTVSNWCRRYYYCYIYYYIYECS